MRDVAELAGGDFEPTVDSEFIVSSGEESSVSLRLVHVVTAAGLPGQRAPFTLQFMGPAEPILASAIHQVNHPELGEFELFLGPVVSQGEGIQYEAVFN